MLLEDALSIAVDALKASEGFVPYPYDDATWPSRRISESDCTRRGGQWTVDATGGTATIGYGETDAEVIASYWDREISEVEASRLMRAAVEARYFAPIRPWVTAALNPNQWAALVSFTYNVGPGSPGVQGGFYSSGVRRVINDGDYGGPQGGRLHDAFMQWTRGNRPGELTGRRQSELDLFFTPTH